MKTALTDWRFGGIANRASLHIMVSCALAIAARGNAQLPKQKPVLQPIIRALATSSADSAITLMIRGAEALGARLARIDIDKAQTLSAYTPPPETPQDLKVAAMRGTNDQIEARKRMFSSLANVHTSRAKQLARAVSVLQDGASRLRGCSTHCNN